jgi:hypothetical protein
VRREGCGSRRTLSHLTRTRLRAGLRVSHRWASVRASSTLGRYSSERRTGCAKERPSGSVRGAPGNWCPYRDRQSFGGIPLLLRNLQNCPAPRMATISLPFSDLAMGKTLGRHRGLDDCIFPEEKREWHSEVGAADVEDVAARSPRRDSTSKELCYQR